MSIPSRSLSRASSSTTRQIFRTPKRRFQSRRNLATPTSLPTTIPSLRASLLLSRAPLLQRSPTPLETTYRSHSLSLRHALSNPAPTDFYFRPDSLPLRRFLVSEHDFTTRTYGPDLAGAVPDVGDIPGESGIEEVDRDKWAREDAERGETSLERMAEREVFCLVRSKAGRWEFPGVQVGAGEGSHEALERGLVGVEGGMGGRGMDTWLVTRKPIGVLRDGDTRTFFLRSHILAGEPELAQEGPWSGWAWLTVEEVEARLTEQGDEMFWEGLRGMFGLDVGEGAEAEDVD